MQLIMLSPTGFIWGVSDQIYHLDEGDTLEVVATLPDGCFPLILSFPIFAFLPALAALFRPIFDFWNWQHATFDHGLAQPNPKQKRKDQAKEIFINYANSSTLYTIESVGGWVEVSN